ncbi:hypothetical protein [Halovivax cerinus]|uniref:Uncharacterized protein n=1 Tax=Halovivax cerinus TaxID=1487865 RepID=A0ABD5NTU8_9EURY|nr:hypothetical protein [Halovivax cerinus]
MVLSGVTPSLDHIVGGASVAFLIAITALIEYTAQSLYDRKIFSPLFKRALRGYKAWRTKKNKIRSDYEFSVYLESGLDESQTNSIAEQILDLVSKESEGDFEVEQNMWSNDGRKLSSRIKYRNRQEPYELALNFISSPTTKEGDTHQNTQIRSIGVTIEFSYEFGKLRDSIIDLMIFASHIQRACRELLDTRNMTEGRIIISPIDQNLTLDDWIEDGEFETELVLSSEDGRSSIEIHSDRAIISSPHTIPDGKTAEYIRTIVLKYYL